MKAPFLSTTEAAALVRDDEAADLSGSPAALAAASVPEGIVATRIRERQQWLSLRESDITASVAAALFGDGVHSFTSAYKLWAEKSGLIKREPENATLRRGRLMEPVILQMLREDYPTWRFEQCEYYYSDPVARIGATPDFFAWRPDMPGFGVVNGKSIGKYAHKKGWLDSDGDVSLPIWVAVQITIEAACCGASWGCAAPVLMGDGGLDLDLIDVPLRPVVMPKLRPLVRDFWRRVHEGEAYPPDWNRDTALVAALYDGENGSLLDLGADAEVAGWLDEREAFKAREADGAAATKARKTIDARLIDRLGNASGARIADGRTYSVKIVRKKGYVIGPSQYPQLSTGRVHLGEMDQFRVTK